MARPNTECSMDVHSTPRPLPAVLGLLIVGSLSGCGGGKSDPQSREVAEWVLQTSGTIVVVGLTVPVESATNLPEDDFGIERIELKSTSITDDGLEKLTGLTNIQYLGLYRTNLVRAEERRPSTNLSVLEANQAVYNRLYQEKYEERYARWMSELAKRAYIEIVATGWR